jgi:hypothetical protein
MDRLAVVQLANLFNDSLLPFDSASFYIGRNARPFLHLRPASHAVFYEFRSVVKGCHTGTLAS